MKNKGVSPDDNQMRLNKKTKVIKYRNKKRFTV